MGCHERFQDAGGGVCPCVMLCMECALVVDKDSSVGRPAVFLGQCSFILWLRCSPFGAFDPDKSNRLIAGYLHPSSFRRKQETPESLPQKKSLIKNLKQEQSVNPCNSRKVRRVPFAGVFTDQDCSPPPIQTALRVR